MNTASIFGGITRDADGKVTGAKAMAFTYLLAQAPLYLLWLKLTKTLAFSYLAAAFASYAALCPMLRLYTVAASITHGCRRTSPPRATEAPRTRRRRGRTS